MDSEAEAVLSADFVSCSVPQSPVVLSRLPRRKQTCTHPHTCAIALLKKELLAVLELALQVAAAPSLEKVEACVAVCDRARKLCA